ncbi:MAG: D-cysteine desulfhydrase [Acidimicrobiales bacterium]
MTTPQAAPASYALGELPTPLTTSRRLGAELEIDLRIKRDDLIGFAQAGTKTRALEFLLADALALGCDTLVGCGGPTSNFCPALAAAGLAAGVACHLVMFGDRPAHALTPPNLAVAMAWGATVHFTGDSDREAVEGAAARLADDLRASGRHPYVVPRGGATAVGACGAACGIAELDIALDGVPPARIVVGTGSGGTAAGLVAGIRALGWPTTVVAAAVSRPVVDTADVIGALAAGCASLLGVPPPEAGTLEVLDAIGPGFGIPCATGALAAERALATEGLVLDPTYTAKAMALLIERAGRWRDGTTVFWHTGGIVGALAGLMTTGPGGR